MIERTKNDKHRPRERERERESRKETKRNKNKSHFISLNSSTISLFGWLERAEKRFALLLIKRSSSRYRLEYELLLLEALYHSFSLLDK